MKRLFGWMLAVALGAAFPAAAQPSARPSSRASTPETYEVVMRNAKGRKVGTVKLTQTPHGVLLTGNLAHLRPGVHAIHFHAVGKCEAPTFSSAGGHFNPTHKAHGFEVPAGMHAGDMANLVVPKSGRIRFQILNPNVTLDSGPTRLRDADGSALVVHAKADDYKSQPSGDAGARVACGVIRKR